MFSTYLAPVGVFTFLTLAQNVLADGLFVGCYKNDGSFSVQPSIEVEDSLSCSTACGNTGYPYSAWQNADSACYCSQYFPAGYYLTSGTDKSCTDGTNLNVRVTRTSFNSLGCLDSAGFKDDGYQDTSVNNPKECLAQCASGFLATFRGTGTASYTCHCTAGGLEMVGNQVTCSTGNYFAFYHSADAQASGLSRKRSREEREFRAKQQARRTEYCPYGLTACNVDGHSGNYECLDTRTELESCGGCMHGQYGNATAIVGEDCTSIGAALGASTCVNGQCVASACKKGLKLVDGKCQQ